jgi:hypothetical protein
VCRIESTPSFVDVAVSCGVLGTDIVASLLRVGGVVHQPRSVHQVEQVAVVGPVIQDGEGLRPGVGLHKTLHICEYNNIGFLGYFPLTTLDYCNRPYCNNWPCGTLDPGDTSFLQFFFVTWYMQVSFITLYSVNMSPVAQNVLY